MINLSLVRQQVEALIDLLERNPQEIIHDMTALEFAAELRKLVGWKPKEQP